MDLDKLQAICDAAENKTSMDEIWEFIQVARTAMPQLIARVRELEAELTRLKKLPILEGPYPGCDMSHL